MVRSTSPTRRRHARAAPSGFIAYYSSNFPQLAAEFESEHKRNGSVTEVSRFAAKRYADLSSEKRSVYANGDDIRFFRVEKVEKVEELSLIHI